MSLTVVGSIAFDAVKTPFGSRERMLGGSAVHFALAAAFFDEVHVVGPVGDDFGAEEYAVLGDRGVNTDDIEQVPGVSTRGVAAAKAFVKMVARWREMKSGGSRAGSMSFTSH